MAFTIPPTLRHAFSFEGRIRRRDYWLSSIIGSIFNAFLSLFIESIEGVPDEDISIASFSIFFLGVILLFWFLLAQGVKRCHDRGNSGWYMLIPLYSLWMLFAEGDYGPNEYGPDPKRPELSKEGDGLNRLIDEIGKK